MPLESLEKLFEQVGQAAEALARLRGETSGQNKAQNQPTIMGGRVAQSETVRTVADLKAQLGMQPPSPAGQAAQSGPQTIVTGILKLAESLGLIDPKAKAAPLDQLKEALEKTVRAAEKLAQVLQGKPEGKAGESGKKKRGIIGTAVTFLPRQLAHSMDWMFQLLRYDAYRKAGQRRLSQPTEFVTTAAATLYGAMTGKVITPSRRAMPWRRAAAIMLRKKPGFKWLRSVLTLPDRLLRSITRDLARAGMTRRRSLTTLAGAGAELARNAATIAGGGDEDSQESEPVSTEQPKKRRHSILGKTAAKVAGQAAEQAAKRYGPQLAARMGIGAAESGAGAAAGGQAAGLAAGAGAAAAGEAAAGAGVAAGAGAAAGDAAAAAGLGAGAAASGASIASGVGVVVGIILAFVVALAAAVYMVYKFVRRVRELNEAWSAYFVAKYGDYSAAGAYAQARIQAYEIERRTSGGERLAPYIIRNTEAVIQLREDFRQWERVRTMAGTAIASVMANAAHGIMSRVNGLLKPVLDRVERFLDRVIGKIDEPRLPVDEFLRALEQNAGGAIARNPPPRPNPPWR